MTRPGFRLFHALLLAMLAFFTAPSLAWAAQLPADNPLPPPLEEPAPQELTEEDAPPLEPDAPVPAAPQDPQAPAQQPAPTGEGPAVNAVEAPGWSAPAVAAASGAALLAALQWATVAVVTLVCAPLFAIAFASAREGNPWFTVPALATGLPLLLGGLVFATALGAAGGLGLAYVVGAGVMGWRFALAPVFAWWAGAALGALVPVGLLALLWAGLVVAVTSAGTLIYAAYLEEANGLRPLEADAQAKRRAAPLLFAVGLGLGAVVLGASLVASQAGVAAVLLWAARLWGMPGSMADQALVLPRDKTPHQ